MAVLPIVTWPDARLSTSCAAVGEITEEIRALAADMLETMYAAPGRGLAAPQVGRLIRLFVMDATWKEGVRTPIVMLNPEIAGFSETVIGMDEGCLSIPGITTHVTRPAGVTMSWTGLDGLRQSAEMAGNAARIAQHETDHLDGVVTFDRLDDAARETALAEYAA